VTIRELINRLEAITKASNDRAHGEPVADFSIKFEEPELDDAYWIAEIQSVEPTTRVGCYCVDGVDIKINVKRL
jgi:hypothetical protein